MPHSTQKIIAQQFFSIKAMGGGGKAFVRFWLLDLTYGPGSLGLYGPGPFMEHTATGAYSKHSPGAVCISNMVLEHIWLRNSFRLWMVQDHKSRPKSSKSRGAFFFCFCFLWSGLKFLDTVSFIIFIINLFHIKFQ